MKQIICFVALVVAFVAVGSSAHAQAVGGSCPAGATAGPDVNGNNLKCVSGTWQVVPTGTAVSFPSRALNTAYQNTSGKTMFISLSAYNTGAGNTMTAQISTNGSSWSSVQGVAFGGTNFQAPLSFVVPNGYYYKAITDGGTITLVSWTEYGLPI